MLELVDATWPIALQQTGERAIGEQAPSGLADRAVVRFIFGVHDALQAELAKAEPDLAAVAAAADAARTANASVHRQVRDAWLNLYGTFTPEQKSVVRAAIQKKLARFEQYREKMRQRHGG